MINQAPLHIFQDDKNYVVIIFITTTNIFVPLFGTHIYMQLLYIKVLLTFSFNLKRNIGNGFLVLAYRS